MRYYFELLQCASQKEKSAIKFHSLVLFVLVLQILNTGEDVSP